MQEIGQPKKAGQLELTFIELEKSVSRLRELAERTASVFAPVVRPVLNADGRDEAKITADYVPLAQKIHNVANEIMRIGDSLEATIKGSEL